MVFISHKKEDKGKAIGIKEYFEKKGVPSWLDAHDETLQKLPKGKITKHIQGQLSKCTHVLAVFSNVTKHSYWVPFELGMAYQGNKSIATVKIEEVAHPEYLSEFPILKFTTNDLDIFVDLYKNDQTLTKSLNEKIATASSTAKADVFIDTLKRRLGQ